MEFVEDRDGGIKRQFVVPEPGFFRYIPRAEQNREDIDRVIKSNSPEIKISEAFLSMRDRNLTIIVEIFGEKYLAGASIYRVKKFDDFEYYIYQVNIVSFYQGDISIKAVKINEEKYYKKHKTELNIILEYFSKFQYSDNKDPISRIIVNSKCEINNLNYEVLRGDIAQSTLLLLKLKAGLQNLKRYFV